MADGIFDCCVFEKVFLGIAPGNASQKTQESAQYVTGAWGGNRAVAEACLYILETFFDEPFST